MVFDTPSHPTEGVLMRRMRTGRDAAPADELRKLISGGLGRHCPAQLRGSVRQRAGGADERRGEKPCGIRELSECGSFRLQKAVPRTKENAAVERREARRSALWAGNPVRRRERPCRKAGQRVRRSAPANFGAP